MQKPMARGQNRSTCYEKFFEKNMEFDLLNGRGFKDEAPYI